MKAFGFLSFGHYGHGHGPGDPDARQALREAVEIAEGADQMGVNGAYFRVHHFARQAAAPVPLLSTIAARTKNIEVGTGVIDLRYENPLYLAEELGALDLLSDQRLAIGVSRGSPEPARRGWEAFGYTGSSDPRGADLARPKFDLLMRAIRGETLVDADPAQFGDGVRLSIEPHSPGLERRIWWGAASRDSAEWAGRVGVNLMSSTLLTEATGQPLAELQAEQLTRYRESFREAGHGWVPRTSVSRSVFPIVSGDDAALWGQLRREGRDYVGIIDGLRSTFGKTYLGEPDELVQQLQADAAVMSADTLMLTIPAHLGPEVNLRLLDNFATHIAPHLGWQPNTAGPVVGEPLDA
ncbi:MAG: LLM class flavin-dependent oxidoreductase [Propionibacteriaceae bacterium]|nr:LLM class flavin-dependent oxidoreductase [Propionibacteriaceae bacterium]